jgi:hypothetical protein
MDTIVKKLQMRANRENLEVDHGDIFELLAAWCPLCCRDGGRGGNSSCAPKEVLEP